MPLDDREQEILKEIERGLAEEDPKFPRKVATSSLQQRASRLVRGGVALFALGIITLLGFFFTLLVPVGVAAFLLMLSGAFLVYNGVRRLGAEQLRSMKAGAFFGKFMGPLDDKLKRRRRD